MLRLGEAIVKWWDIDNLDWKLEYFCTIRLARFVLQLGIIDAINICKPVFDRINDYPREVSEFINQLVYAEDIIGSGEVFWNLWQNVANIVLNASWTEHLKEKESDRSKLIMLFS